jgi:hypothetical protein
LSLLARHAPTPPATFHSPGALRLNYSRGVTPSRRALPTLFALPFLISLASTSVRALDWQTIPGAKWAAVSPAGANKVGFTTLNAAQTGIAFTNLISADRSLTNQIYLNGSGVAAGDVDGDGWCDLFFTAIDNRSVLYRNLGNWRFEDISAASGLPMSGLAATGAAFADLDGDGDLDLVFNTVGRGTHILLNDGQGHFAESAVINGKFGGMSLALGDFDMDGDLDLYVANYRTVTIRDEPNTRFSVRMVNGKPVVAAINGRPANDPDLANRFTYTFTAANGRGTMAHEENGEPDGFFRNDGRGHFTPVPSGELFTDADGKPVTLELDWGLSVMFRDINQDGAPDLYVCNDFKSEDRMWLNDGRGHFRAAPKLALRHGSLSSMGVDFADLDRDGFDDFLIADMLSRDRVHRLTQFGDVRPEPAKFGEFDNRPAYARNNLYLNGGDGTYREIAQFAGLDATDWTWSVIFLDVDLDGYEDLLVTNGFERDNLNIDALAQIEAARAQRTMSAQEQLELRRNFPRLNRPNYAFRNQRNLRFEERSAVWGFHHERVSTGMALADLDNDGDMDVVINNINDGATVLRNDAPQPRVAIRLKGAKNTRGIGARIEVSAGGLTQSQEIISGGRYLSSDDPMRVFAVTGTNIEARVRWPSGLKSTITNMAANSIYEIDEAGAQVVKREKAAPPKSPIHFEDASARLNDTHVDQPFDDFGRQPLLPKKLSQLGPGVTWHKSVASDAREALVVSAGKGGEMAIYRNKGAMFERIPFDPTTPITRDQTSALFLGESLLVGSANYEDGLAFTAGIRQFNFAAKSVDDSLTAWESSAGPLAMADIDGDGDLDLFCGGRCVPGKYPLPASSWIFRNTNGKFEPDAESSKPFANAGMVSGAVFADLNSDGWPDLVLACEWGPVRVFMNEKGSFTERTRDLGLNNYRGLWNSVAVGDFDNDGRLDIVAGNEGSNSRYESYRAQPIQLIHGDFDDDGTYDVIEAGYDAGLEKMAPMRGLEVLSKAMPLLKDKFPNHKSFAMAGLEEILGEKLTPANRLSANWLETTVFLNRGGKFEARALPAPAQFSPVFGIVVADFDNDGSEDLFLAQNFFDCPPEVSRADAGWGLVLRGDGAGNFQALAPEQSGVRIAGEQRGAAAADFDRDGRIDFAVGQNAGPTKLFRNDAAAPGLRVRLFDGIGATIRADKGPARVITAGTGYWSCDSETRVFPKSAKTLEIKWPGGAVDKIELDPALSEVEIARGGKWVRKSP